MAITALPLQVVADEHDNQELLWAVRGAGSALGVVTRLTFKLYPTAGYYGGIISSI